MIKLEEYLWRPGQPIPNCDCHGDAQATHKLYTKIKGKYKIGMRLCERGVEEVRKL